MFLLNNSSERLTSIRWNPARENLRKTTETRGDRPSPTSSRLYVNICVFKNWKHQQDFLFSQTVKCHYMSCVVQYVLVKKELFPLNFTTSSESPLLITNHSSMNHTWSQQWLIWTTTAIKFKSLSTFTKKSRFMAPVWCVRYCYNATLS